MAEHSLPDLSVIVLTPDRFETIRKVVRHVRAQDGADRLELVVVTPSPAALDAEESELDGFHGVRIVETGTLESTARARAAGVFAASAPLVAFVEDHAFPSPGWARALIDAHRDPNVAAVGPLIVNANPKSFVSWTNFLVEYGEWCNVPASGPVAHLPGHNSSYKRDLLVEYGGRLGAMMEAESVLQWDLASKGHVLHLETAAKTLHLNMTTVRATWTLRFNCGRAFASARARRMPFLKRLVYVVAGPLIPFVRLRRILGWVNQADRLPSPSAKLLPVLWWGLTVDGFGELCGYAFGPGRSGEILADLEFRRHRFLKN